MPKSYYLPPGDNPKAAFLNNLATKLPTHAPNVGVSAGEVTAVQNGSAAFRYALDSQYQVSQSSVQWTAYKNALRDGPITAAAVAWPVATALPTAPATVPAGIFAMVGKLVQRIKNHPGYTDAIGQDLGIIGAEQTVDMGAMKPTLNVQLSAGHPTIQWDRQGMDAVELWVDRGSGFVFLAIDSEPDYNDTAALPAGGGVWKYKGIYRLHDEQVGQWSDIVSVSVGI